MEIQELVVDRWSESAKGFSGYVNKELGSFKGEAWLKLISESLPKGKLKVLDVGSGPGFFSIILSKAGHEVIGIDCTDNMIKEATANSIEHNVSPKFLKMDSHTLDFSDNSFDLIINRNVTWTLYDPIKAYTEWKRVLKSGGKLMVFDANWHMFYFDELLAKRIEKAENEYRKRYHEEPFSSCEKFESKDYMKDIFLADKIRPNWDSNALLNIGYSKVEIDTSIIDQVYDEKEMLLYSNTPLFKIVATK